MVYRNSCFNANSVDPDQMLHSAVSDIGLHCFPFTLLRVSRLKWVKRVESIFDSYYTK